MAATIHITVWNEFRHEKTNPKVKEIYPHGMHVTIAEALRKSGGLTVGTATLDEPEHGLTSAVLEKTNVLIWWGHAAHDQVQDEIVARVHKRVLEGMGLVVLHSGHYSKIFKRLMGTTCSLTWREAGERERLWVCNPGHPIVQGIDRYFELENEEMYGEPFGIADPDETILVSWFQGGEVFRSGCTFHRGNGKIFYFRPGHEMYPTYHSPHVQRVLANAVHWAAATGGRWIDSCPNVPIEKAPEKITARGATLHKPGEQGLR